MSCWSCSDVAVDGQICRKSLRTLEPGFVQGAAAPLPWQGMLRFLRGSVGCPLLLTHQKWASRACPKSLGCLCGSEREEIFFVLFALTGRGGDPESLLVRLSCFASGLLPWQQQKKLHQELC